ncbi:MAG: F0F1 ATP synthase subunit B [Candidatus Omnitrophica bacterium]|nr:F0F1 ATP synthase subunit B [Candidatus Omnitrophota bacterium]MDD5610654.1 F0F1 ATP synthase subunit B [Candidatus Omnitrophota bacterium]
MELLSMLSANELVAQTVSFLILFFILRAFFWKPILKLLDERKEKIASELKSIEEEKATAQEIMADYEAKLKTIDDAAKAEIQEAVLEGQKIIEQAKSDARSESEKIIIEARAQANRELAMTRQELKDEVVDLVLDATEHLLEEKMSDREDRRIVKSFLDNLDKT